MITYKIFDIYKEKKEIEEFLEQSYIEIKVFSLGLKNYMMIIYNDWGRRKNVS